MLGFLSFMVISAVAFAIYMRAERVPSSALRRNVATRHLVKAALAHAMSRVDDAIRADPFPGMANTNSTANCYHDEQFNAMDVWFGRVFMPPNPEGLVDDGGRDVREANDPADQNKFSWRFAPATETVSVLNLEALGYIPPPLVNDVRFLSRSSWTAKWQNFPFDAGRFAFCAVNVSDYFDINRMSSGVRTSYPDSRISLSYLFRNSDSFSSLDSSSAETFANYFGPGTTRTRPVEADVAYVSMLDYNLALGSQAANGIGMMRSFFWWWIDGKGSKNYFYESTSETSQQIKQASRQTFVTDSFSADQSQSNVVGVAYLQGLKDGLTLGQPFREDFIRQDSGGMTLRDVMMEANKRGTSRFTEELPGVRQLDPSFFPMLYDYLDGNDYPLSIAYPSVERIPMVASLDAGDMGVRLTIQKGTETAPTDANPYRITSYTISGPFLTGPLKALCVFPFKRDNFNHGSYQVQAMVRVYLGEAGGNSLRTSSATACLRPTADEWKGNGGIGALRKANGADISGGGAFVLTAVADGTMNVPKNIKTTDNIDFPVAFNFTTAVNGEVFQMRERMKKVGEAGDWQSTGDPEEYHIVADLFDANGGLKGLPGQGNGGWITKQQMAAVGTFVPYVTAWVRILQNNTPVDYVPAMFEDDQEQLGVDNLFARDYLNDGGSQGTPLLKWVGATPFDFGTVALNAGTPYECMDWGGNRSYFTVDPRFNWAPEDWVQTTRPFDQWYDFIQNELDVNGRDSDPFMFVSNQGYLQSPGELAFLPRITEVGVQSRVLANYTLATPRPESDKADGGVCNIAHRLSAWTSYRPYAMNGVGSDNLFNRGVFSGASKMCVNPYSDSEDMRLAAFANTPYDWWAAGTNYNTGTVDSDAVADYFTKKQYVKEDDVKASLKYAFTDSGSDATLSYNDVKKIANAVCGAIAAQPQRSWQSVYDSLDWYGDPDNPRNFLGVTLDNPLDGVDRKYLYGYWRDCLANSQQLFLIFVRAESTALGGPGEGTPAQQGGRAVALVWRDPQSNNTDGTRDGGMDDNQRTYQSNGERRPHRMRVLFYHQFD